MTSTTPPFWETKSSTKIRKAILDAIAYSEKRFSGVETLISELTEAERLGIYYKKRADALDSKCDKWCLVGVVLVACIFIFYFGYSYYYIHEMEILENLFGRNEKLSQSTIAISYYTGKILGLVLLTSALIWCARIYNHLRRLKITYRDKEVAASSYYSFMTQDKSCHEDVRKYALEHIFKPTLQQIEQGNKDDKSDSIDIATLKTIAELLAPLIKKSE